MRPSRSLLPPLLVGAHLGLLQVGLLLTVQRVVSAAHTTYALVLLAWLVGGACGLWVVLPVRAALALGLVAYLGAVVGGAAVDFLAVDPWWFTPAIALAGLLSGRYFAAAIAADAPPAPLFARETHGFLLGTLLAAVGYACLGRHALWAMPLATGAALLAARRGGGALVGALVLSGCDDPERVVPAPERGRFEVEVYPLLLRDCAFAGCHGDPRRPLFTPGPGRTRLGAATEPLDPPTRAELDLAYDRTRALMLAEGEEPPPLLHKPGAGAAHRGRDVHGANVYEDPESPGLEILTRWAEGTEP